MTDRPHIVHAIGSLGLGGDAKNLCALARVQRAWARVSVMTLAREPGPRAGELERASIPCVTGMNEPGRLREWLRAQDRPIVYFHRNGAPDAHETEWLRVVHEARCPTFEYNTFGRADAQSDSLWVGHAHLSRAALLQYANRRGASLFAQEDHAAIGYAVDDVVVPNEVERDAARRRFGIPASAFVALRLQRPDLRKWSPLPVMALRRVILQGEDAWLVVRAAPPTRETWIRRATELRCTLLPPSADADDIRATLVASDVMVNYSNIGETFGLALAEGMAVGLPVIVNSTPSLDNAQVEHCRHGETGLVANSPAAIAAALRYFAARRHLGRLMGEAGRRLIATRFAPASVDARLRVFMRRRLAAVGDSLAAAVPVPDAYVETYPLDEAWLAEHEQRSRTTFDEPGGELRRLADALEVRARGASDTLTYSRSIGLVGFARAAASRLRAGSLQRG